jgi:hypothetical protein
VAARRQVERKPFAFPLPLEKWREILDIVKVSKVLAQW